MDECVFQREEASAREAARKRGESFQRDSNRLRQDKVTIYGGVHCMGTEYG